MPNLRITAGNHYADIVQDRRDSHLWVYVIQREGSSEVLAMGTCTDETQCKELAQRILTDITGSAAAAS